MSCGWLATYGASPSIAPFVSPAATFARAASRTAGSTGFACGKTIDRSVASVGPAWIATRAAATAMIRNRRMWTTLLPGWGDNESIQDAWNTGLGAPRPVFQASCILSLSPQPGRSVVHMRLFRIIAVAAALVAIQAGPTLATERSIVFPQANPVDPAVLDAARAKVAAGDTKGAIDGLAPYVASHPQDIPAGRLLGDLYFRVPDYAKAEKVWKAILAIDSEDRETHSRLGALYAVQDRVNDALYEFQQSLPSRSGYAGLVMIHKRAGDLNAYMAKLQGDTDGHPFDVS